MLVLTRKKKQLLMLGDDIEIQILDIHGDQVRIGITAPRSLQILRKELYTEIQNENRKAVQAFSADGLKNITQGVSEKG